MFRISEVSDSRAILTVRFEGRLVGAWVLEARRYCEQRAKEIATLRIDLADLLYLDRKGVHLLADLRATGVCLLNASPFVERQLKALVQG